MSRTKAEMRDKIKEIEKIIEMQDHSIFDEYLDGLLDGVKWSAQKILELDLERFK